MTDRQRLTVESLCKPLQCLFGIRVTFSWNSIDRAFICFPTKTCLSHTIGGKYCWCVKILIFECSFNQKGRGLIATLKKHYGIWVKLGIALQGYYSLIVKMVVSHWVRGGMNRPIAPNSRLEMQSDLRLWGGGGKTLRGIQWSINLPLGRPTVIFLGSTFSEQVLFLGKC